MIQIRNGYKKYKNNNEFKIENLNLSFEESGLYFIVGPSGKGKSTILNLIGGLDRIDSGSIIVNGLDITALDDEELSSYRNNEIGFIFQEYNLIKDLNVYSNISLSLELQGVQNEELINELLEKMDLKGFNNRKIASLSGGESQRVAIARALIKNPSILLCDEPTGALDSKNSQIIFNILKEISKDKLVIVVSHDEESANIYADKIIHVTDNSIFEDNETNYEVQNIENEKNILKKSNTPIKRLLKLSLFQLNKKKIRLGLLSIISCLCIVLINVCLSVNSLSEDEIIAKAMYRDQVPTYDLTCYVENFGWSSGITEEYKKLIIDDDTYATPVYSYFSIYNLYNINPTCPLYNKDTFKFERYLYYDCEIQGCCELTQELIDSYGYTLYGKIPQADNEIVIPYNFYQTYEKYGYERLGEYYTINSCDDLIGKTLYVRNEENEPVDFSESRSRDFTICGILDTGFNVNDYINPTNTKELFENYEACYYQQQSGFNEILFLNEGYIERNFKQDENSYDLYYAEQYNYYVSSFIKFDYYGEVDECDNKQIENSFKITKLYNENYLNNYNFIYKLQNEDCPYLYYYPVKENYLFDNTMDTDSLVKYTKENYDKVVDKLKAEVPESEWTEKKLLKHYQDAIQDSHTDPYLNVSRENLINILLKDYTENYRYLERTLFNYKTKYKLGGLYVVSEMDEKGSLIVNEAAYKKLTANIACFSPIAKYVVKFDNSYDSYLNTVKKLNHTIFPYTFSNNSYVNVTYKLQNQYTSLYFISLYKTKDLCTSFKVIGLISLGLSIIISFMYADGIVKESYKENGILLSLGMNKKQIKTIYYFEGLIISSLIFILSNVGLAIALTILNNKIINYYSMAVNLSINPLQVGLCFGISLLSIFLGIMVMVNIHLRKRPVDLLNNR